MSKKVVIVPKHKWTVVSKYEGEPTESNIVFFHRNSRTDARRTKKWRGGTVRKVSKIVYYYE